ncbi:hypothetical protein M409DRAFT_63626 [Zasmidium cellare ATCC 36951]|uniref:OsmC-like protein n=1 Tax=Zasmidium cellare ATCC 36951 TaxID=1080233 RepID=A0A6A6CYN8_ZASCE|nr:uncharacterized protein M409DRAFT_63626 [Zasmidium cellare ATCC 36951]KAF2171278.1 hypothetical protein M409DRAFT_63626 [Zasmidium cellare ATCC 36951]
MASVRAFRPLLRTTPRLATITPPTKRFLNAASAPALATSHAKATGGRQGKVHSDHFDLELGMPKSLGGDGAKTNPEELFAAGYGACFQGAMGATAPTLGIKLPSKPEDCVVDCTAHLIGDLKQLDLGIRVDMHVWAKGMKKEDLQKLVDRTKEVCPYSVATKGNVVTNVSVEVA